jgi:hypothetical protein
MSFLLGMPPTLEELRTTLESVHLLQNCSDTREAVSRCCLFFREEGRFDPPIGFHTIGALLGIDAKTVWANGDDLANTDWTWLIQDDPRFLLTVNWKR